MAGKGAKKWAKEPPTRDQRRKAHQKKLARKTERETNLNSEQQTPQPSRESKAALEPSKETPDSRTKRPHDTEPDSKRKRRKTKAPRDLSHMLGSSILPSGEHQHQQLMNWLNTIKDAKQLSGLEIQQISPTASSFLLLTGEEVDPTKLQNRDFGVVAKLLRNWLEQNKRPQLSSSEHPKLRERSEALDPVSSPLEAVKGIDMLVLCHNGNRAFDVSQQLQKSLKKKGVMLWNHGGGKKEAQLERHVKELKSGKYYYAVAVVGRILRLIESSLFDLDSLKLLVIDSKPSMQEDTIFTSKDLGETMWKLMSEMLLPRINRRGGILSMKSQENVADLKCFIY
eukprot:Filipodium_phascolosomae@DN1999_c0_g1_i1.p1